MCDEAGIGVFYGRVKELNGVWFGNTEHSDITRQMQAYILYGGVYGTLDNRVAVRQKEKGSKAAYLLYRIFMPYQELKINYPVLEKHKWLYPIITVRRWFCLLIPQRRRHAKQELKNSLAMSDTHQDGVASLLSNLDLSH